MKFSEFQNYPYANLQPGILFYKFLAKRDNKHANKFSLLRMWIPDTIVYEEGEPFWVYSDHEGTVHRDERFLEK